MAETPQPAAHEDAQDDTRTAAKWLIGAFAGVGALLLSGIGLTNLGRLEGNDLELAIAAFAVGVTGVIVAVYLIVDVLTPAPVTMTNLAEYEQARNERKGASAYDELVKYIESDPALLQGIVKSSDPRNEVLILAARKYREALDARLEKADAYWDLAKDKGEKDAEAVRAKEVAQAAANRATTMHSTVRRLEQIATSQQSIFVFKARRGALATAAIFIALSIGTFAVASNPPEPPAADLRGAKLEGVDLSGASLRDANLEGMTIKETNFEGTNLEGAKIDDTVWDSTVCPDGTSSDNAGETCAGHLEPEFEPGPLP